jgi:hypothetical protein
MEARLTKSSSRLERQAYWREQLLAWAQSGVSQKQFCQQRDLSPHAFTWWKAKYRDELNLPYRTVRKSLGKDSRHGFLEVKVCNSKPELLYEVVLGNHRTIRVGDRFEPESLMRLIKAVESIC